MTEFENNRIGTGTWSHRYDIERERAAYHMAGHVVVAYWLRWPFDDEGVVIRERDHSEFPYELSSAPEQTEICVHLAGWLAEILLCPSLASPSDDELHIVLDWADWDHSWADVGAGDFGAFRRLVRERRTRCRRVLIAAYRAYEIRTVELLRQPIIWKAVEQLASALLERGRLSSKEVVDLLAKNLCAGALN